MKRILALVLVLMLCMGAMAEGMGYIECDCGKKRCVCFLQEGDTGLAVRGVIEMLKEKNFLDAKHSKLIFDKEVTQAVKDFQKSWGIDVNGILDDMTLTLLIWDDVSVWYDEDNAGYAQTPIWVPTKGGYKQHRTPTCKGMVNARKMSALNALALGLAPCKTCSPM